jgi:UDP-N-acetyl-D-mannosaminuronic acid transferase (WecB/TagA/CpsF family)
MRLLGSDIFAGVMQHLDRMGGSVFFLGASDETVRSLCERIQRVFPSVRIAGSHLPPFKPVFSQAEIDEMVSVVNAVEPDVLWIGMTSLKQDVWIHSNLNRLKVRFAAPSRCGRRVRFLHRSSEAISSDISTLGAGLAAETIAAATTIMAKKVRLRSDFHLARF